MKRGLNKKFEKEGCSETKIYKWISGPSNWFTKELHKMNKEKETIIDIDWQIYCENNQGVPIVSSYLISIWRPKLERQDDDQRVYYNQLNKLKRPAFESIGRVLIMNVSTVLLLNSDIHMSWICSWTVHNLWCNNIESPITRGEKLSLDTGDRDGEWPIRWNSYYELEKFRQTFYPYYGYFYTNDILIHDFHFLKRIKHLVLLRS